MKQKNVILFAVILFFIGLTELQAQTVKDIDGNVYKTVTINKQVWMAENLRTTKYNDGTAIPLVTDDKVWAALITPAFCWYNNDETRNKNKYGALYNWYTVSTNKLCPKGWHVSLDKEWATLTTYLGGEKVAGGKLKEIGTIHWKSPNTGATNESGFTALPSGSRATNGSFRLGGEGVSFWSSMEHNASQAWFSSLTYNYSILTIFYAYKQVGWSIRCLMD
jgi:uncharacterized protein (TIGR02145 family)